MSLTPKNPRRIAQLRWSKSFRSRTQYMSMVIRPQTVRMRWLIENGEEKQP
jgi:hypothetical protein